jgi:hypothetical protein
MQLRTRDGPRENRYASCGSRLPCERHSPLTVNLRLVVCELCISSVLRVVRMAGCHHDGQLREAV